LVCLAILIAMDIGSIPVTSAEILTPMRALHGFVGGVLTGIAFAVIARTANPDRTFGMLLFVQFGLGGLGVMVLPPLAPEYGTQALFIALALFSFVTLLMTPFLDRYPADRVTRKAAGADDGKVEWGPLGMTLLAIFLFQAANMGLLAYIIRLGIDYGLDRSYVSTALGLATWVALLGPFLVMVLGLKFGRARLFMASMALTLIGTAIFHFSGDPIAYMVANCGTGITWGFVIAYLLGMSAEFDKAGRASAFGGFISKIGLATGPLVAGWMLGSGMGFTALINAALAMLALSALVMLVPAMRLDRLRKSEPEETGAA
jgi:MFS family permease